MNSRDFKDLMVSKFKLNSLIINTTFASVMHNEVDLITNKAVVHHELTNGLHMLNPLYLYTNPPPIGYGTPAPKAAETVSRAYEYNRNTDKTPKTIDGYNIVRTAIMEIEDFPLEEVSGNYNPAYTVLMSKAFLVKNIEAIDKTSAEIVDWIKKTKSDEMSRGRQTWDPEIKKSVTCARAFNNAMTIIRVNLNKTPTTMLELLKAYFELYQCDSLKIKKVEVSNDRKRRYSEKLKMTLLTGRKRRVVKKAIIYGRENIRKWLLDYTRSFCSYLKHKERGKLDRRAIASANPFLRMLLKIVEEFHLRLSKTIEGSTISIGGDEKKKKIITELKTCTLMDQFQQEYKIQGTEDAQKWNECMTPSMFALVHHTLFSQEIREEILSGDKLMEERELLLNICNFTFLIMSIKRINLGLGLKIENDFAYTRKMWSDYSENDLNEKSKEWFKKIKDTITDHDYIEASPGFLMGMLNAASTIIGLLPSAYIDFPDSKIKTLRSSDDSMSVYVGKNFDSLSAVIYANIILGKLLGINLSKKKTLFFNEGFGEYTSWYQDNDFVGQSGVETSALKPDGINPQEDFNNLSTQTAVLMRNYTINVFGAWAKLLIGLKNIRRLYNINRKISDKISEDVLFLSDGGKMPWDLENLLIDESTIRYNNCKNDEDLNYVYKVLDPSNPFSAEPEDRLMFSKDEGQLVINQYVNPINVFSYVKKSNCSINNKSSKSQADYEKFNREAFNIATTVDPSLFLHGNSSLLPLGNYLCSNIEMIEMDVDLTKSERELLENAKARLLNRNDEEREHEPGDDAEILFD